MRSSRASSPRRRAAECRHNQGRRSSGRRPAAYRVVGVIHLPALPGTVRGGTAADLAAILERAKRDADTYAIGGVDALIVENFGDVPFTKRSVSAYTVAAMTLATDLVRAETGLPVGVNVLRNDVESAVSIAAATGAVFVRANVYVGAAVTDQGLIEGRADQRPGADQTAGIIRGGLGRC